MKSSKIIEAMKLLNWQQWSVDTGWIICLLFRTCSFLYYCVVLGRMLHLASLLFRKLGSFLEEFTQQQRIMAEIKDLPFQFPELAHIDHKKSCPRYNAGEYFQRTKRERESRQAKACESREARAESPTLTGCAQPATAGTARRYRVTRCGICGASLGTGHD